MAVPFLLLAVAQQWIDTGLAGMINATAPLFTALLAALLVRALPSRLQGAGLVLGFLGVVAISLPSVDGGSNLLGVAAGAAAALALWPRLQPRRAAPAPARLAAGHWRAMLVAAVALLPAAVVGALTRLRRGPACSRSSALGVARHRRRVRLVHRADRPRRAGPRRRWRSTSCRWWPWRSGRAFNDERVHVAALLGDRDGAGRRVPDQPAGAAPLGRRRAATFSQSPPSVAQLLGARAAEEALAHAVEVGARGRVEQLAALGVITAL